MTGWAFLFSDMHVRQFMEYGNIDLVCVCVSKSKLTFWENEFGELLTSFVLDWH